MSLYQKYRPTDFSSLIGQSFVARALTAALLSRKTVGVYLFCGSRGTGKTSVARILAKAINCMHLTFEGNPCGKCANCTAAANGSMLDIIEIDGASNNGVANVRELIERARFQPSMGAFKVYIIDEVHMLSSWAFNALLKILEEPPSHVKFILATTESHKIPDTIISRSQRYDFRKISEADIIMRLQFVAKEESIEADDTALALVAKLARWGLRDALSLFEQYSIGWALSYDFMMENLSLLGEEFMAALVQNILIKDIESFTWAMNTLRARSIDPRRFAEELLGYLRNRALTLARTAEFAPLWSIFKWLSEVYPRLKDFPDGFILIEMTFLARMSHAATGDLQNILPQVTPSAIASAKHILINTEASPLDTYTDSLAKIVLHSAPSAQWINKTTHSKVSSPFSESDSISTLGSPNDTPSFSYPLLVDLVKNTPKKWILLNTLKTGSFKYTENPPIFTLISRTEFDRSKLDNAETRDFLAVSIESLFGVRAQIEFTVNAMSSNNTILPPKWLNSSDLSEIF